MDATTATPIATPSALPDQARCLTCGYLLRGLSEPRCPECGRGFDPADRETYTLHPPPHRLLQLSVAMLSRFVFWGAIGLILPAAAASALPGLWMPAALLGFLFTGAVVLSWFTLLIILGLLQRFYGRGPSSACKRALLAPFACAAVCLLLLRTEALSHFLVAASKPAMNRLASEALQVPPRTELPDRWVGCFHATWIQAFPGGVRFKVNCSGWPDSFGYAYSPHGPPSIDDENSYEDDYTSLGDGWYLWKESL